MSTIKVKNDGKITIAVGDSRMAAKWKNTTMAWSEFLQRISETTRTRETVAEYRKMPKQKQDGVKDVGGFIGGWLKGGKRKVGNLESRSLITLDADFGTLDLLDGFDMIYGNAAAVYSTHKHTSESPRLRLIVPLSRKLSADEYQAAARKLAESLGMDLFDDTTYQPTRLMYWPSTSYDGDFVFQHVDGPFLDPDELLAQYPDWKDTSYWPESSRSAGVHKKSAERQGDPTKKPGIVGAFCRCYDIDGAIARFLPDRYTACALPNRYTFTGGSTAAGLVVYDDGLFAYSNHATDPISGREVNAFDLVRLHLFGDQDADQDPNTPVNKLPSYAAMSELARTDEPVKSLILSEQLAKAREDFSVPMEPENNIGAMIAAGLTLDRRGRPEPTINNVFIILTHDPLLAGTLAFNTFKERLVVLRPLPWKKTITDPVNGDVWNDTDDSELRRYIELAYGITGKERIMDAVAGVAHANPIHPIKDYLSTLAWDGVERLDTLLVDYLSAEDSTYTRAVTRKCFTAAVARILNPGCKFDYILTLSGPQGRGKSTLVYKMARGWSTDSLAGIGTKEAYEGIQGFWLVELGELAAMRKTEIEITKNFISKQVDSYRAPYGRRVEDHKRQCIFIGTTNSTAFLRDDTGNRRFWPIRLLDAQPALTVWGDLTDEIIDQLWAEAIYRYRHNEPLTLPADLAAIALEQQALFTEDDPRAGDIATFLDTLLPEGWAQMDKGRRQGWFMETADMRERGTRQRERVCVAEIWQECFGKDPAMLKRQDANELHSIMRRMPGWKEVERKVWFGPYGAQRGYQRIADDFSQIL